MSSLSPIFVWGCRSRFGPACVPRAFGPSSPPLCKLLQRPQHSVRQPVRLSRPLDSQSVVRLVQSLSLTPSVDEPWPLRWTGSTGVTFRPSSQETTNEGLADPTSAGTKRSCPHYANVSIRSLASFRVGPLVCVSVWARSARRARARAEVDELARSSTPASCSLLWPHTASAAPHIHLSHHGGAERYLLLA